VAGRVSDNIDRLCNYRSAIFVVNVVVINICLVVIALLIGYHR
jgi:hypothetical protein